MNSPSLDEFRVFQQKIIRFINPTFVSWHLRVLFEAAEDRRFMEKISRNIDLAEGNLSSEDMEKMFMQLRKEGDILLNKTKKVDDLDKKYDLVARTMTVMGFIECLNEDSLLPDNILSKLKKKWGDNYLSKLQEIDRQFFSDDVKKMHKIDKPETWPKDDDIRKYLVLKKWQDIQHKAFMNEIEEYAWAFETPYSESKGERSFFPEKVPYVYTNRATKIRALLKLSSEKLVSVDRLAIYHLAGLDKELVKLFGGKAYGLVRLKALGVPIPETYLSPLTCSGINQEDLNDLSFSQFAVRSSADIEDGTKHSFAGMFDSILDVSRKDIVSSFEQVKASISSDRVQSYIKHNNLPSPNMAVVIQRFEEPQFAGVWIGSGDKQGILEWVEGNGEKLVSGQITPTTERWDLEKPTNPISIKGIPIAETLMEMQKKLSETEMADFEWCVLNDQLVMLQYRPVTVPVLTMQRDTQKLGNEVILGLAASPGIAEGTAKFLLTAEEDTQWQDGDILMARFTTPEWMSILTRSRGIVTAYGGFLSHTAIVARELGVPCVVGIGDEGLKRTKENDYLKIDGNRGVVELKKKSKNNSNYLKRQQREK